MITTTLQEIRNTFERLTPETPNPIDRLAIQPLPLPVAYHLKRAIEAANKEYQRTEDLRTELIKRLGEKTSKEDEPEQWKVPAAKMVDFSREFTELLKEEITLDGCRMLTIEELGKAEISTADLFSLGWLIGEPETAAQPKTEKVTQINRKKKAKAA